MSPALKYWDGAAWQTMSGIPGPVGPQGPQGVQGVGWSGDASWIAPTLLNGWVSYAANFLPGYRKNGGMVVVRGLVRDGTAATVMTFPVGYRPNTDLVITGTAGEPAQYARLDLGANGTLLAPWFGSGRWVSIHMTFYADQ